MTDQSKPHVVIADYLTDDLTHEKGVLGDLARISALDAYSEEDLRGRIEDADAIMLFHNVALTSQTIDRLEHCRLITRCGVGVDNVDLDAARRRGIPVANVPDYGTEEVADSAIGMALALTRGFSRMNSILRNPDAPGLWNHEHAVPLYRLRGRVFGIVGLGRIGTATALRAKALGMDVVFYDPYLPDGYDKTFGIRRTESLRMLIEQSYVVSLHCPRTPETENLIDAQSVTWFRPGSYLVNTSRGPLVDTSVIPTAIESGRLSGVALDVLPKEPPAADDPLLVAWRDPQHPAHHRLIVNPHAAFYCEEGLTDMRVKAAENCRRAILGQAIRNVVNGVSSSPP